jgi:uncharacterized protein involved in exopolysaccharide biosynthesis/Mrp family chromosome partitioning ATPase
MTTATAGQQTSGLDVHDVLFALFRHKWKLLLMTLLGLIGATASYLLAPKSYQSNSKLLVKYVLERSTIDPVDPQTEAPGRFNETLMSAEVAILWSWDLAVSVAEAIGPDRLLMGEPGEPSVVRAAAVVQNGLEVRTVGNVISVSFRNKNPALPQPVLEELVRRYFDKHLEVHRSIQAFDFVSQQRDLLRGRIDELDTRIKNLKEEAGIVSAADSEANLQAQILHTRQALLTAEVDRAQQMARSLFLNRSFTPVAPSGGEQAPPKIPAATIEQYLLLQRQLSVSRRTEAELYSKYTEEAAEVKSTQSRIQQLTERLAGLEAAHPPLAALGASTSSERSKVDLLGEQTGLAAIEARSTALRAQLNQLEAAAVRMGAFSSQLLDLMTQREVDRKNYSEFQLKLEKSRIDEALDPSRMPNISVLQKATPAGQVAGTTLKVAKGFAAGGLAAGLVLALGFGLLFDRTVKRPRELESRLHIPLLVSIPRLQESSRKRLRTSQVKTKELALRSAPGGKVAPWALGHFVRPFAEGIRNRLILGFELKKIDHKPKLIGVTSLTGGEGASTMAGGLAASFSETGDGKVLLVDMNADNPEMRPFFEGNASGSLLDALRSDSAMPTAGDNLFLATGKSPNEGAISLAPKRFYDLLPVLRSSTFDYIIFDLPSLDQSGATLAVSGFMDKIILMVEAEKNDRGILKRAHEELVAAKADVAAVLNKTDTRMPKWALG